MTRALDGVGVLVTRPVEQAAGLARAIEESGGRAILFPAMRIEAVPLTELEPQLNEVVRATDFIFVSPTAARVGVPCLNLTPAVQGRRYFAVGEGTARELKKSGLQPIICPEGGADSEALLALPELQDVAGHRIAIVRGEGGRDLMIQTLQRRSARLTVIELYRRTLPAESLPPSVAENVQAVTATSREIVTNLFSLGAAGMRTWLTRVPFFVPHPRIGQCALRFGVRTVCVTRARGNVTADQSLVEAMSEWFAGKLSFRQVNSL
jgi:uroporphyrinogen-III synthase